MSAIVGVHGIMNQQLGRNQLIADWAPAIADGLEVAAGHQVPIPDLDVAFYGDLFLSDVSSSGGKGLLDSDALADLSEDEVAALTPVVQEAMGPGGLEEIGADELSKAYTRVPLPLLRLLRGLDRRFGSRAASWLFLGELKQVRRYLLDPELKAEADARTAAAIGNGCKVVIGHSLGSVVAFEFVRQHEDQEIDLLLTLGSPLGLTTVRKLMKSPTHGADRLPRNIHRWVNLRDPHDPVACAGDLSRWWPGISDDGGIENQGDAHSVERYLGKRQAGRAILDALPEAATRKAE